MGSAKPTMSLKTTLTEQDLDHIALPGCTRVLHRYAICGHTAEASPNLPTFGWRRDCSRCKRAIDNGVAKRCEAPKTEWANLSLEGSCPKCLLNPRIFTTPSLQEHLAKSAGRRWKPLSRPKKLRKRRANQVKQDTTEVSTVRADATR